MFYSKCHMHIVCIRWRGDNNRVQITNVHLFQVINSRDTVFIFSFFSSIQAGIKSNDVFYLEILQVAYSSLTHRAETDYEKFHSRSINLQRSPCKMIFQNSLNTNEVI